MLGFMPTPYPDEIFYSVLARYHVYSGNKKTFNTVIDLFGKQVMVSVWWQGNLSTLIGRFPVLYPIDKETIIQEHTLLPLFALFMEKTRADEMIENTINQDEQRVLLRSVVGVQGNMDKYLNYCPCCVTQDIERYGESYWHRTHQIPGVLVCPQHGEQLIEYEIKRSYEHIIGLRDINLLDKVIDKSESQKQWSERIHTTLFEIAKDFQYLLNSEFQSKNIDFFHQQYRGFLIERQLIFPSGIINRKKLIQEFETFFGTDVLEYFGLNFYGLLIRVLQQGRGTFPPIFHVMLMRFLQVRFKSLSKQIHPTRFMVVVPGTV